MKKGYWLGALVFVAITLVVLYLPTLRWLWYEWFKPEVRFYSHGLLVLLISSLLVLRNRRLLAKARPWRKGSLVVLLALGLGIFAQLQNFPSLSAYSLILLIIGLVLLLCGRDVTRQLLFPLLFLILAVPFPFTEPLAQFLAKVVAAGSVGLAEVVGIQVIRGGTWIQVSGYSYSIDPLCSSLNIMLALLTLVLPVLYVKHYSWVKSIPFLLATPVAALIFKILLVTLVFWMTQRGGQETALGAYHGWAGILAYLVSLSAILLPLIFFTRRELRQALVEAVG